MAQNERLRWVTGYHGPLAPGISLARRLLDWLTADRSLLFEVGTIFLASRIALIIASILAVSLVPERLASNLPHPSSNPFLDAWTRWDGNYYLGIARFGYNRPDTYAFFPLYPLLIRFTTPIIGNQIIAALLISNLAFLGALVYLAKLTTLEFGPELRTRTLLYLTIAPLAFFFFAVYTESLFLFLSVACFYHARRGQWWLAGLAGLLAGTCRVVGILLTIPLLLEFLAHRPVRLRPAVLAVAAPAFGLAIWLAYNAWQTGNPLTTFLVLQYPPFDRVRSWPPETLAVAITRLLGAYYDRYTWTINAFDLLSAFALIVASFVAAIRLRPSYAAYIAATALLLLSSRTAPLTLISISRYVMVVFPLFWLLAQAGSRPWLDRLIQILSPMLLAIFLTLFARWYWAG